MPSGPRRRTAPHMKSTSPSGKPKKKYSVMVHHYGEYGTEPSRHSGFFANKTEARSHYQDRYPEARHIQLFEHKPKKKSGQDDMVLGGPHKGGHAGHGQTGYAGGRKVV